MATNVTEREISSRYVPPDGDTIASTGRWFLPKNIISSLELTTIAQEIQRTEYVIIKMQTLGNCSGPTSWFLQQVKCEEKKTGLEGERKKMYI